MSESESESLVSDRKPDEDRDGLLAGEFKGTVQVPEPERTANLKSMDFFAAGFKLSVFLAVSFFLRVCDFFEDQVC